MTSEKGAKSERRNVENFVDDVLARNEEKGGDYLDWFEELYARAGGDSTLVPWGDEKPHLGLIEWMSKEQQGNGKRALDVGCGLGDNAAFLAENGYDVLGLDLSQSAVDWAAKRFTGEGVSFRQADLFALPDDLIGKFDLVHETYTLQALPREMRPDLFKAVASLVAPGGHLLVISRTRREDVVPDGPPWPLSKSELDHFLELGLEEISVFEFTEQRLDGRNIPQLRVEYKKTC